MRKARSPGSGLELLEKRRISFDVPAEDWGDWHWQLRNRLRNLEDLERYFHLTRDEVEGVELALQGRTLPLGITPYFASLMDPVDPGCPLRRQGIPTSKEGVVGSWDMVDPLAEDADSPVPHLVHRYPDRVLLLVTNNCPMFCRYCTRRRIVGQTGEVPLQELEPAYDYIRRHRRIRDVLISGGDPLTMSTERLEEILGRIREISHVEIVRIGTRAPVTLPMRIDDELLSMLRRYHPIWMSLHFTHPMEITPEVEAACNKLADAGIPLGSQTVLLKGINDSPLTMKRLVHKLLTMRVRPYYLYQCDSARGISHFKTPVRKGIEIIESLRGFTSGYAVPTYVIDAPGGGGKIPISPNYLLMYEHGRVLLRNYKGYVYEYRER
ncbi:MAG: KamA family radical SAM protein [Candidatus Bathyarchaeia archaeon]